MALFRFIHVGGREQRVHAANEDEAWETLRSRLVYAPPIHALKKVWGLVAAGEPKEKSQ